MQSVQLTCGVQGYGCGRAFPWPYNEHATPFFQDPKGTMWQQGNCPNCNRQFKFAWLYKDPAKPGLLSVFD